MLSWLYHWFRERSAVRGRDVVAYAFAALMPYIALAVYLWTKDGRVLGFGDLLGDGDLLPSAVVLCAHSASTVLRRQPAGPVRLLLLGGNAFVVTIACVAFTVPETAAPGYESRLAVVASTTFALATALATAEVIAASRSQPKKTSASA